MNTIRIDRSGSLSVDGNKVFGQIERVNVRGIMIIDSAALQGSSGKKKVFSGYDDADITIVMKLLETSDGGNDRYNALTTVGNAFKKMENGVPVIYAIEGDLFQALNVRHVLFMGLDVDDDNEDDTLQVNISFAEHDPVIALVQQQQSGSDQAADDGEADGITVSDADQQRFTELEGFYE